MRKILTTTTILLMIAFMSCQKDKAISVTEVTLNKATLNLTMGGSETLTANVQPSNADNKTVSWSSSTSGVASVDASGKVTAVAVGTTTITVTTEEGGKTATCNVTVSPIVVTGVTLNKTTTAIAAGGTETLVATVAPANATNKNVTWSSNNTARATVDATGKVSVPASATAGEATITATTVDGGKTATCTVTVPNVSVAGVTLNKTATTIAVGGTETLVATVTPANATNKNVTWSSNNTARATVDATGKITIPASATQGTVTITATTVDGNKTATCTVTVSPIAVTGVTLNKTTTTIAVGGTETLVATVTPANATNKNVTWSSNNTARATVDATGKVTVPASATQGAVIITVTTVDGNKMATCTVTISFFEEGDGTSGNPFIIRTPAQLDAVRNNLSAHYKLGNDINLTSYLSSGGAGYAKWGTAGWDPIGAYGAAPSSSFIGSLNGANYKITGLWINYPGYGAPPIGLFCGVSGGSIQNLGVEIASGGIYGGYYYIGGVAGEIRNGGRITNCYVMGNVKSSSNPYVGGIVGSASNSSSITNCFFSGDVSGNSNYVGGIAGGVSGNSSITNCYATGSVSGYGQVGGVIGDVSGGIVTNCVALNSSVTISGRWSNVGRVAGAYTSGILSNNWAHSMTILDNGTPKALNKGNDKIDGADCAAVPTQSWWSSAAPNGPGFKFGNNDANPWKWSSTLSRPVLYWQ